jgi:hypothetical protein
MRVGGILSILRTWPTTKIRPYPYITDDKIPPTRRTSPTTSFLLRPSVEFCRKPYSADNFPYLADDKPYLADDKPYIADI